MDAKLISWAYAVKARQQRRWLGSRRARLPPLWVFSDAVRLPDPRAALLRVPKALCGLVLRNAATMDADCLRQTLALCRARRFPVVMVRAGLSASASLQHTSLQHTSLQHIGLRGIGRHFPGKAAITRVSGGVVTAAAHGLAELRRARPGSVDCVFLSPVFATRSHPGGGALGPRRWSRLGARARVALMALGGVSGANIGLLDRRRVAGAGSIGAAVE